MFYLAGQICRVCFTLLGRCVGCVLPFWAGMQALFYPAVQVCRVSFTLLGRYAGFALPCCAGV